MEKIIDSDRTKYQSSYSSMKSSSCNNHNQIDK